MREGSEKISFGKRFKKWRQSQGISAYRIAKLAGVHPSFISNIEANRRPMSEGFMKKLAALPELNITYETLRAWKAQAEYNVHEIHQAYDEMVFQAVERPAEHPPEVQYLEGLYRIPLKMTVSAGLLEEKDVMEEPVYLDWYGLKTVSTDLFCMRVKGNSMWPPIPDGAVLLVREVEHLQNGGRYVIETEDARMTFKLVQFDKQGAYLVPLNPEFKPISLGDARLKRLYQVLSFKVDWS